MNSTKLFQIVCFIVALLLPYIATAQDQKKVTVKGKVVDATTNNPLEYTTVTFITRSDSSLVAGEVTDQNGNYSIPIKPGNYILKAQFLSYKTQFKSVAINEASKELDMGTIKLAEDINQLQDVEIRGKRTQMEMKLDKRVFNVGADLINQGLNVSEILDNLPSITVDMEGNVSLRGSQNVRILINGKASGLTGISTNQALQMLSGNMVERVEVITNPSARYQAEGSAGIVNIILKKDKRSGINGSFNLTFGHPADHDASINLNYRKEWFNLFLNYGLGYRNSPREGFAHQEYYVEDSTYYIDIDREMSRKELSNSFRFGSDFYLNEKNTITVSGLYNMGDGENDSDLIYNNYDENYNLVSRSKRVSTEFEDEELFEYEVNYEKKFEKKDHKLTVDVQYRKNGELEDSDIQTIPLGIDNPDILAQSYLNDENEENYLFRGDYIHPITDKEKFEAGFRSTLRNIDNDFRVEEQNESGKWVIREEFTNNFLYDEDIHALYALYGKEFEKFDVQAGLRTEYTLIKTELVKTNEVNDNEYLNLFPSIHLTYDIIKENSVQLSYSRRFDRPSFWDLNPFFNYIDTLRIRSGNPALQPEFTHSMELGYLNNWEKGSFYYGAYFRNTTGVIERISFVENGITFMQPQNLAKRDSYGLEANISNDITDFWNIDGSINLYRQETFGEFEGQDLHAETFTMSGRMNTRLTVMEDYEVQARGFYRAPERTTQGKRKSFYSMDVGVSREVLKGKGTVSVRARNILNSMKWRSETRGENFYYDSEYVWRPRQFSISFDYRLNNDKGRKRGGGERNGGYGDDNDGGGI